jgi:hypothetical protein
VEVVPGLVCVVAEELVVVDGVVLVLLVVVGVVVELVVVVVLDLVVLDVDVDVDVDVGVVLQSTMASLLTVVAPCRRLLISAELIDGGRLSIAALRLEAAFAALPHCLELTAAKT